MLDIRTAIYNANTRHTLKQHRNRFYCGTTVQKMVRDKSQAKKSAKSKAVKRPVMNRGRSKPHRFRPGTVAYREIKRYQIGLAGDRGAATKLMFPKSTMKRVIREALQDVTKDTSWRISAKAVEMLHAEAEEFLLGMFQDGMKAAVHRKGKTLEVKDLDAARFIGGNKTDYSRHRNLDGAVRHAGGGGAGASGDVGVQGDVAVPGDTTTE